MRSTTEVVKIVVILVSIRVHADSRLDGLLASNSWNSSATRILPPSLSDFYDFEKVARVHAQKEDLQSNSPRHRGVHLAHSALSPAHQSLLNQLEERHSQRAWRMSIQEVVFVSALVLVMMITVVMMTDYIVKVV